LNWRSIVQKASDRKFANHFSGFLLIFGSALHKLMATELKSNIFREVVGEKNHCMTVGIAAKNEKNQMHTAGRYQIAETANAQPERLMIKRSTKLSCWWLKLLCRLWGD
jgi:hypothetical protein